MKPFGKPLRFYPMAALKPKKEPKPTYSDFLNKIKITDILARAGYRWNEKDGRRYPSYVRYDADNRRVGDKFIVTPHGTCFQPPEHRNFNVISFIKEHPSLFREYRPGKNLDLLVNEVCRDMIGNPMDFKESEAFGASKRVRPFSLDQFSKVDRSEPGTFDFERSKSFYRFFAHRGITYPTLKAFAGNFMAVDKKIEVETEEDGRKRVEEREIKRIGFPMSAGGELVGMELRGSPYGKEGEQKSYKGMAVGSDSSRGAWTANLSGAPLSEAKDIYWFESAYDAMAFYQLKAKDDPAVKNGVFVSSGGTLTRGKVQNILGQANPSAVHHLGFDADTAGRTFAVTFALVKAGRQRFNTQVEVVGDGDDLDLAVIDPEDKDSAKRFSLRGFDFDDAVQTLGIDGGGVEYMPPSADYKDWNDQLLNKKAPTEQRHESVRMAR